MLNSDDNIQYSQCLVRGHKTHITYICTHHIQIKTHMEHMNVRVVQSYLVVR